VSCAAGAGGLRVSYPGDIMRNLWIIAILVVLVACGDPVTSDEYLARGKAYIETSDYPEATIELQNSLKQDPGQSEARWLLGNLYLGAGDPKSAEYEFLRAQEIGWPDDDILPALASVYLVQGEYKKALALEHEGLSPAGTAALLSKQALVAMAAGEPDKAVELVDLAEASDPGSNEVKLAHAMMELDEEKYATALKLADTVLEADPKNNRAWRLKAQALIRLERLEEARDALDHSIQYSQIAFADRVARALINLQLDNQDAARADAAILLELAPDHPAANYIQGLLDYHDKDYIGAIKTLNLAEPVADQYPLIYYYLAVAYQFEVDLDLSANYVRKFVERVPDSGKGRKLQAITLIQNGDAAQAEMVLRPLVERLPNDLEALNILANALLLEDHAYEGLVIYRQIKQLDPDWEIVPLHREAKFVTGGAGEVGSTVSGINAGKDENFPQNDILEIMKLLEKKDFPAAIELARSYQFRDVKSLSAYHVLGMVYLAAGQPEDARAAFEKALKREPGDPFAHLNLAQLDLEHDDVAGARKEYATILEHDPNHLGAMMQLAALELREKKPKEMEKWLQQAMKAHPESLEPRLVLARYYLTAGRAGSVIPLFSQLDSSQRHSPKVMEVYGLALMAQGQFNDAVEEYEELVALPPESAKSHYLLAVATSGAGDPERSKSELNEALKLDDEHVPSLLSLAKIASTEGDKEAFEGYVARLVEVAPDSLDVIRLQANIARANGDNDAAVEHAKRAFALAPSSGTAIELASYQWSAGRDKEARAQLEAWIAQNPGDIPARMFLANQLQTGQDIAAAIEQYQAVLKLQPGNPVALNNLAWCLKDTDPKQALKYIDRAASMASDNASILDTFALILHETGDNKGARASIERALEVDPGEPSIQYHAAMIYVAVGEKDKAIGLLRSITGADAADFPERAEAAALLSKLGG